MAAEGVELVWTRDGHGCQFPKAQLFDVGGDSSSAVGAATGVAVSSLGEAGEVPATRRWELRYAWPVWPDGDHNNSQKPDQTVFSIVVTSIRLFSTYLELVVSK